MSADDSTGVPRRQVGEALVAALGFEPTATLTDATADGAADTGAVPARQRSTATKTVWVDDPVESRDGDERTSGGSGDRATRDGRAESNSNDGASKENGKDGLRPGGRRDSGGSSPGAAKPAADDRTNGNGARGLAGSAAITAAAKAAATVKPAADKGSGPKPGLGKPGPGKPGIGRSGSDKPGGNRPDNSRAPAGLKPGSDKPGSDRSSTKAPAGKVDSSKVDSGKPGSTKVATDKQASETPGGSRQAVAPESKAGQAGSDGLVRVPATSPNGGPVTKPGEIKPSEGKTGPVENKPSGRAADSDRARTAGSRPSSDGTPSERVGQKSVDEVLVPGGGDDVVSSGPPTAPTRVVAGGAQARDGGAPPADEATKEWTGHDILATDMLTVASPAPAPPTSPPLAAPGVPDYGVKEAAQPAVSRSRVSTTGVRPGDLASRVPQIMEQGLRRGSKVRARKVRRVVRHIDPWSVLTFSVIFHLCVFAALLLASVLVWNAAEAAGTIENIESFIQELGDYTDYEIAGDVVFRAAMIIAGVLTLASSVLVVLLTVVFNLISDLVGGIRMTVVEEETVKVNRHRNQNQ